MTRRKRPPEDIRVTPAIWAISCSLPFKVIDAYWDASLSRIISSEAVALKMAAALFLASRQTNLPPTEFLDMFLLAWSQQVFDVDLDEDEIAMAVHEIGRCFFDILSRQEAWEKNNPFCQEGISSLEHILGVWEDLYQHNIDDFKRRHLNWLSA